ncbi:DUF2190 family protein [Archangium violaceum]|uniref:DUF2190 family protein n=1 Tax=Archangium violaceum TaxID=83451 RepID=UPI0036DA18F6
MKNYRQAGDTLTLTAPAGGVTSGSVYLIGALLVVATFSADDGAPFTGARSGVYELPKAGGEAWAQGAALYWDNNAKKFTTTATNNTRAGYAVADALSAATVGAVLLTGN